MGSSTATICVVVFLVVLVILIGLGVFYYYKKNLKQKNDLQKNSKKKSSSSSSSSSSSKSSKPKSPSSRRKSRSSTSSSKKGTSTSRRRSSRSRSIKTNSSKRRGSKTNIQNNVAPIINKTPSSGGYPGEIKVEIPSKNDVKVPGTESIKSITSKQLDEGPKKVSSNTSVNSLTNVVDKIATDKTKIESVNIIPPVKNCIDDKEPKIVEKNIHPSVVFENCPSSKELSNDLLKYKTNTHYIPPTSVVIPKENKQPFDINSPTPKNDSNTKSVPNETIDTNDKKSYTGSLLTTNNITYNNVNILVNNSENSDVQDPIDTKIPTISEPNTEVQNISTLPSLTSTKVSESDDDWEKM